LRGRSGRQGDAGSSRFYLSLEDELMRIFGSDKIKSMMTTLKVPEDMPIENKMITRSIESAQKKVEGNNFDIRKHLVEYDDVINKHREVIYQKRREVLEKDDISDEVMKLIEAEIEAVVSFHTASDDSKSWNIKEIYEVANSIFVVDQSLRLDLDKIKDIDEKSKPDEVTARTKIINHLNEIAKSQYDKLEYNVNQAMQSKTDDQDTEVIPMRKVEKQIYLRGIDNLWVEHLDAIDHLRRGIGLRGYGQRDPLVEYKKEAYSLFTELMNLIQKQVVYSIYKVGVAQQFVPGIFQRAGMQFAAPAKTMEKGQSRLPGQKTDEQQAMKQDVEKRQAKLEDSAQTHYNGQKVGRNDPCPCGSGKKFKKCHGA